MNRMLTELEVVVAWTNMVGTTHHSLHNEGPAHSIEQSKMLGYSKILTHFFRFGVVHSMPTRNKVNSYKSYNSLV